MFYKAFGFLPLCLFFNATLASPNQGNQDNICQGDSCENSGIAILQKRAQKLHTSDFFEEEDEDDGAPKRPNGGATSGAIFTQAGMKRDRDADFMEEEEKDYGVSSHQRQPRASWETDGMAMYIADAPALRETLTWKLWFV
eukprot:CAMPEP_0172710518 /NCGR_PEP_ID=MMETSP1074-20121228/55822_1 /TAXON_ID=2916 /ORGANISM="Ceratium fusus, Strain PA161109" /LENGTH=140 /DNA_ID=CAMNT_0013533935 /DNA_START=78 /DNA_END=498 /DNA_ORIENTATION=+